MISIPKKDGLSDEGVRDSFEKFGNNNLVFKQVRVII